MVKQGLQKFTDSRVAHETPESVNKYLEQIIKGEKINLAVVWNLTEEEKHNIEAVFTAAVITLAGDDREAFLDKTEDVLTETSKSEIWERNHYTIMSAVDYLTRHTGQMPTTTRIATETQLSRNTVTKHLKEYYNSQTYKDKSGALKCLREGLLMKVYYEATKGNMKAAKLFLEATKMNEEPTSRNVQNQQNNFVQINGTVISQEQL